MSVEPLISPAQLDALTEAAFGPATAPVFVQLIDRELCARCFGDSKVGFVFRVGSDESPRLRVSTQEDGARLAEVVERRWPDAASFFEAHGDGLVHIETNGESLRLYAVLSEPEQDDAGRPVVVRFAHLGEDGPDYATAHETPPVDELPAALVAALQPLLDGGARGLWFVGRNDGEATSLFWTTEQPRRPESAELVDAIETGPRFNGVRDLLVDAGLDVNPYMLEFTADGAIVAAIWGAEPPNIDWDAPVGFERSGVPSAAAMADTFSKVVPAGQRAAAQAALTALHTDRVFAATRGESERDGILGLWAFLEASLAAVIPPLRGALLDKIARVYALGAMQRRALNVVLARYAAGHPKVEPPAELPEGLRQTPIDQVLVLATEQLMAFAPVEVWVKTVGGIESLHEPGFEVSAPVTRDHLERALSGDFTAAEGELHSILSRMEGGYDNDPTLDAPEMVQHDPTYDHDELIEEALALDDDDEF